jgi:thioredoxin 1
MNKEEFLTKVKANPRPVVVDVWAPWCAPCRMIAPALQRLTKIHTGAVDVWKINADEEPELARELDVLGIPTLIVYRNGQETSRRIGAQPEAQLAELFDAARGVPPKARRGPAARDRILRLGVGTVLAGVGLSLHGAWTFILVGALVAFSAVYDRCPVWNALVPRVGELRGGKKTSLSSKGESGR